MKSILLLLLFIAGLLVGPIGSTHSQSFLPGDTCFANAVSLITYNSARINTNTSNGDVAGTDVILNYVRYGQTDTVRSSTPWPNALRNLTGLQSNTVYVYYYAFSNGSEYIPQSVAYYFTTLPNYITYTPMTAAGYQFKYGKFDSGLAVPRGDTSLGRAPAIPSIVYKNSDNTYYAYHTDCTCWQPLAIDSSGIIGLLDGKVDSVTVAGDSLWYWKQGVSYGYVIPASSTDTTSLSDRIDHKWSLNGDAGTNPSSDGIGTNDGVDFILKANNLEFQRLVPYVGTDTGYFGYVINSNYVTSPSDFASQFTAYGGASSSTVAGGKELTVGATNFSQGFYVPNIWPATVLGTQTYRAVGIKTAANNGLMIAQEPRTTALNYWARIWIEFDFNTRTAAIKITNGLGTTTLATSSALASISTGDSVACEFAFDYDELTATITNLNTAATTSISHTFVAPNYAPTVSYPCLIVPLTTNPVVVQSMQFYLTAYKHPDFNFVGHSVLHGYSGVTRAELVPELVRAAMPDYKIQLDAMGSMKIADVMLWIDEIQTIDATYVPLMIGANDAGTSDATFYSGYRALRDSIEATGSQVIHFGQLPQTSFNFTARNDSLKTLYESLGDVFIDIFPLLKNGSGYDYLPYYDVGDGIHPSAAGDSLIASQFYIAMSSILGPPVNQNYIDFSQRGNLQKVFSYETQQAFNSDRDLIDKGYVDSVASSGGVSSVAVTGNDGVVVAGSPITSTGTITLDLGTITPTGIQNASGTTSLPSYSFSNDVTVGLLLSPSACGSDSATRAVANIPGCSPLQIQNLNAGGVGGIDYYNNSGTLVAQNGINNSNNVFYYQNVASGGTHLFTIGATEAFKINNSTTIEIGNLAGSGTRMVEASSTGLLSATNAAPTSSTYTPTLDNTTNVSSSTPIVCHYIRVGNQVTVTGSVTLTTTGTGATVLGISLPIASNFGATTDCSGLGNATVPAGFSFGNYVEGSAANDRAELKFDAIAATSGTIFFVFTFTVI